MFRVASLESSPGRRVAYLGSMDVEYPGFGWIVVNGERYGHDVVIERGATRERDKTPSRSHPARSGHTPLSIGEDIPWDRPRLVIGSGHSGRLPVLPEVYDEASMRQVELVVLPTADACELLQGTRASDVNALLHVTC